MLLLSVLLHGIKGFRLKHPNFVFKLEPLGVDLYDNSHFIPSQNIVKYFILITKMGSSKRYKEQRYSKKRRYHGKKDSKPQTEAPNDESIADDDGWCCCSLC